MTCTYSAPKRMGRPTGSGRSNSPRQCSASVMRTTRDSLSTQSKRDSSSSSKQARQQRRFRGEEDFTQSEQDACITAMVSVDGNLEHVSHDGCVVASVVKSCDGVGVLASQSDPDAVSLGAWTGKASGTHESIEVIEKINMSGCLPCSNISIHSDAMRRNELLSKEIGIHYQTQMWDNGEVGISHSQMNDISIPSLNSPSMQSVSGPDEAEPGTDAARKSGQRISFTPSRVLRPVLEPNSTPLGGYEHRRGAHWIPPTPGHPPSAQSDHFCPPPCQDNNYERYLYQLSKLHLDLCSLLKSCPREGHQDRSPSTPVSMARIDAVLTATQRLIKIVQQSSSELSVKGIPASCSGTLFTTSPQRDPIFDFVGEDFAVERPASIPASPEASTRPFDHGPSTVTTLLIMTCYLRLLHIYEPLVASLHRHLQQQLGSNLTRPPFSRLASADRASNPAQSPDVWLPTFSFGSFSTAFSTDMNVRLLMHLISQMLEQIHGAVRVYLSLGTGNCVRAADCAGNGVFGESPTGVGERGMEKMEWLRRPMASAAEAALNEAKEKEYVVMEMLWDEVRL